MKQSLESSQNVASTKKFSYYDLKIESRQDVSNIGKADHVEEYKPEFSWQLYNSVVSEGEKENNKANGKEGNSLIHIEEEIRNDNLSYDYRPIGNRKNEEIKEQQLESETKNEDKNYYGSPKLTQREIQILYNKQLSNTIYLRTQVQELLRLVAFSIVLEEEQLVKNRIYELNSEVRRLRIRSISKKRHQNQIHQGNNQKNFSKIDTLKQTLRHAKLKSNRLQTKLILMGNYLKVTQKKSVNNQRSSSFQFQPSKSPVNSFQAIEYEKKGENNKEPWQKFTNGSKRKSYLSQEPKMVYFPVRRVKQSREMESNSAVLLEEHILILRQTIQNQRQYIERKTQMLLKEKLNLKRQIQSTKLSILKLENEGRRFRVGSSNSIRKLSLTSRMNRNYGSQKVFLTPRSKRKEGPQIKSPVGNKASEDIRQQYFNS